MFWNGAACFKSHTSSWDCNITKPHDDNSETQRSNEANVFNTLQTYEHIHKKITQTTCIQAYKSNTARCAIRADNIQSWQYAKLCNTCFWYALALAVRNMAYFLQPALEHIKNTYCMGKRPFLYFYVIQLGNWLGLFYSSTQSLILRCCNCSSHCTLGITQHNSRCYIRGFARQAGRTKRHCRSHEMTGRLQFWGRDTGSCHSAEPGSSPAHLQRQVIQMIINVNKTIKLKETKNYVLNICLRIWKI